MDILSNLALGLSVSLTPSNILYCLIGTVLGTATADDRGTRVISGPRHDTITP